ncbi:uncharacterized protein A1O9_12235 [Exophiala aquamarina CBS 119918]|uniref:Uncharacterized protein n=1 Tax=Exophiala aquamarina CBS 119918 TaxID=1182545 RepID=A0A072P7K8_9EURO|nr:uncharacterized protein A1O9_12235 [Exophiala aquamarina CBS 119918]KEF51600.1 hypothetical protein A1O9_12235 [Exophiala aquamarina CBS 119918]
MLPGIRSGNSLSPHLPSTTTEALQPGPDSWTHSNLDPVPDILLDVSNVTSLDFEDLEHVSIFEANAELAFDVQLPPQDVLFDLGSMMELPECYQEDLDGLTVPKSHPQGPLSESLEPIDTLTALSKLNEDISRQISQIDSRFCGPTNAVQHCLDQLDDIKGNPVEVMLQSTSRFVTILENLSSLHLPPNKSIHIMTKHQSSTSTFDSGDPNSNLKPGKTRAPVEVNPLSTPVVLMVLSSYLLLLGFYDAVFIRVREGLSRLDDICTFFQDIPEIRVDGLSSMKMQLYAKLIISVVEYHFGRLEFLLGLPVEFGLSGQPTRSKGLLGAAELSHLIHVSMTQKTGDAGTSGRSALQSFRENLSALRAMLPG